MNTMVAFVIEIALTLSISALLVRYLRPFLTKILLDLCGTQDRAQFWTAFANILLIGMPILLALGYSPKTGNAEELFFEIAGKLSGNLAGLLAALIGIGCMVSIFALFEPKPKQAKSK